MQISDHLPQFMIVINIFCNPPSNKANIFERDWSNFDQENFILDYFSIDWNVAIKLDDQNVDYSAESFLNNRGREYEWRSSDSAVGYFTLKITS